MRDKENLLIKLICQQIKRNNHNIFIVMNMFLLVICRSCYKYRTQNCTLIYDMYVNMSTSIYVNMDHMARHPLVSLWQCLEKIWGIYVHFGRAGFLRKRDT